jgi:hypothetical protein
MHAAKIVLLADIWLTKHTSTVTKENFIIRVAQ